MFRKPDKHELMADFLYALIAATVSLLAIFVFDIHWSLYPGETFFPPSRRVFEGDLSVYYMGVPAGTLVGFFLLKLVFFAFMEEKEAHENGYRSKHRTVYKRHI
jgi:hypothetical protein